MVVFVWLTILFDFRWYKYGTAHFGKIFLCTLWSLALAKMSCNNIKNSHMQLSRLCYFWWLCFYESIYHISIKLIYSNIYDILHINKSGFNYIFYVNNKLSNKILLIIVNKPLGSFSLKGLFFLLLHTVEVAENKILPLEVIKILDFYFYFIFFYSWHNIFYLLILWN